MGFSEEPRRQPPVPSIQKQGKNGGRPGSCPPTRQKWSLFPLHHHNSGRPPTRVCFDSAREASPSKRAAKATSPPGSAHAPLALFSVGPKPRPFCVLRGGLGAESSRDHSSLSLLQHLVANGAGKRGGAGASAESGGGGGGGRWPV